jgi:hypothetical protein
MVTVYRLDFLDLGTSWSWVVSYTLRPFYLWGKSTWYPLYTRMAGPQNWTWRRENSCPCRDSSSDPSVVQPVGSRYINCAIPAPLKLVIRSNNEQWNVCCWVKLIPNNKSNGSMLDPSVTMLRTVATHYLVSSTWYDL